MQKWEYVIVELGQNKWMAASEANRFGSEGWEMVACDFPNSHGPGPYNYRAVFKRPIIQEEISQNK